MRFRSSIAWILLLLLVVLSVVHAQDPDLDTTPYPTPTTDLDPTPTTDLDSAPTSDPDPAPTSDPDPAPTSDLDPTPTTDLDPTPSPSPSNNPNCEANCVAEEEEITGCSSSDEPCFCAAWDQRKLNLQWCMSENMCNDVSSGAVIAEIEAYCEAWIDGMTTAPSSSPTPPPATGASLGTSLPPTIIASSPPPNTSPPSSGAPRTSPRQSSSPTPPATQSIVVVTVTVGQVVTGSSTSYTARSATVYVTRVGQDGSGSGVGNGQIRGKCVGLAGVVFGGLVGLLLVL